jgi:hypothetical protein
MGAIVGGVITTTTIIPAKTAATVKIGRSVIAAGAEIAVHGRSTTASSGC